MSSSELTRDAEAASGLMDAILATLAAGQVPNPVLLAERFDEPVAEVEQFIKVVQLVGACADRSDAGVALDARVRVSPVRPQLGDFRILREIGRGGMGVVYEAEQLSLERRVALKVLLPGVEVSEQALQRFQREAHTAGGLHHKHIVPVFAVGADDGVPYFAMQYVAGRPLSDVIRQWRSEQVRPTAAHFRQVARWGRTIADALAHAHRNRVIHRDVKPSNILLDAAGEVWITDFGLARYDTSATLTLSGDIVGTLRYMSPEQARGGDLDERTDVYSLGVTLYELATLQPAFDGPDRESTLRRVLFDRPARVRQINPAVPRDLQTIIEKAIARAPEERYPSAALLAEDLARFLEGQRLLAAPPSVTRQVGRLIDRHKPAFALGGSLLVLLIGFSAWMTLLYYRAEHGRELAESGRVAALTASLQEQRATARATASTRRADQIRGFLESMLTSVDPEVARGRDTDLLRDLLRQVERRIERDLAAQPRARARLHETIGRSYHGIWQPEQAGQHLQAAVDLRRQQPDEPGDLADALGRLAALRGEQGRYAEAEDLHREALATLPDEPGFAGRRGHLLTGLGGLYFEMDRLDEAQETLSEALDVLTSAVPREHRWVATCLHDLGLLARKRAQMRQAVVYLEEAAEIRAALLGADHPLAVASRASLAAVHYTVGDYETAVDLYRDVLAQRERLFDADHPRVAETLGDLAIALHQSGRTAEGYPLARRALEIRRRVLGPDHPDLVTGLVNLAGFARVSDRTGEAEVLLREAIVLGDRVLRPPHHVLAAARRQLADVLQRQLRFAEAEPLMRSVLAMRRELFGPDHPQTAAALSGLAAVLNDLGRHDEAAEAGDEALAILRRTLRDEDPRVIAALVGRGATEMNRGRLIAAEELLLEALDLQDRVLPQGDWRVAETESLYAETLVKHRRYDEAEPILHSAIERLDAHFGPEHPRTELAIYRLLHLYRDADRPAAAVWALPIAREAVVARAAADPVDPREYGRALVLLGQIERMTGADDEAETHLRAALANQLQAFAADDAEVAGTRSALGACLTRRGQYTEAEQLLLAATEDLTGHYSAAHPSTQRAYERLAELYEATGRDEAAAALRAMLPGDEP